MLTILWLAAGWPAPAADSGFAVAARATPYPIDWTVRAVVTDALTGRVYAVGEQDGADVVIAAFEPDGALRGVLTFPAVSTERVGGATVAPDGRLIVVGSTDLGFPWRSPSRAAFVLRLDVEDPNAAEVRLLGDEAPPRAHAPQSEALAVTADAAGAIFVAGWTNSSYYPVTEGAARTEGGGSGFSAFGPVADGFLTKLSPDLTVEASTFVGGRRVACSGGSGCLSSVPHTVVSQVALGPDGAVLVAGVTNTHDDFATPGAFQQSCHCLRMVGDLFVAKLTPDAAAFDYATYVGGRPVGPEPAPWGPEEVAGLRVLEDGSAVVAGWSAAPTFPTTPGALQPRFGGDPNVSADRDGVLFRLSPDGSRLLFSTFLGVAGDDTIEALDRVGDDWWVTGAAAPAFPGAGVGPRFVARLSMDARQLLAAVRMPLGATGGFLAAVANGVWTAGPQSPRLTLLQTAPADVPAVYALTNAAGSRDTGRLAAREIISLYGVGLGPAQGATADLTAGPPPVSLAGLELEIAGSRAGLLYAGPTQINAVATATFREGQTVDVVLRRDGVEIADLRLSGVLWNAEVFADADGFAAALNEQGLPLGPDRPARPGETISLFLSGGSASHPFFTPRPELRVDGLAAQEVTYFGPAPGLIDGVTQLNARLPLTLGQGALTVLVGGRQSEPVRLWVDLAR